MKISDRDKVAELTEKFTRAVRSMRALNEHTQSVKVGFGSDDFLLGVHPYSVEVAPGDRQYAHLIEIVRKAAMQHVGDLSAQLKELGVDTNA